MTMAAMTGVLNTRKRTGAHPVTVDAPDALNKPGAAFI